MRELYVSNAGNDSNPGTSEVSKRPYTLTPTERVRSRLQAPFRTIWRALNVSRTLGRVPRAILLNAGRYVLNETISLSEVPSYAAPLGRLRLEG